MNNFQTIIAKLKVLLSQSTPRKIHDKDVAVVLGITPSTFASMKRRNTLPYKALLDFCAEHHINANTLLFQRPVNNYLTTALTIRYEKQVDAPGDSHTTDKGVRELNLHELFQLVIDQVEQSASAECITSACQQIKGTAVNPVGCCAQRR